MGEKWAGEWVWGKGFGDPAVNTKFLTSWDSSNLFWEGELLSVYRKI